MQRLGDPAGPGASWGRVMAAAVSGTMNDGAANSADGRSTLRAQAILATGLYDRWYGICPSDRIGDRPVALKRWGRDLVAWRDRDGAVHVQDDRCPHRGARLSLARHERRPAESASITAPRSSPTARWRRSPASPAAPWSARAPCAATRCASIAARSMPGTGPTPNAPPADFSPPERLTNGVLPDDPLLHRMALSLPLPDRQQYGPDARRLSCHTTAHSMQQGSRQAAFRTRDTETGFVFEKIGQKDLNFDWSEWYDRNFQAVCLEIPYPATGGPGGNFGIVFHVTPIDAEDFGLLLLAPPQGERLAGRCLAVPLPDPAGGTALARPGAGPARHGNHGCRRRRARTSSTATILASRGSAA